METNVFNKTLKMLKMPAFVESSRAVFTNFLRQSYDHFQGIGA
jgi:hypothetical protein